MHSMQARRQDFFQGRAKQSIEFIRGRQIIRAAKPVKRRSRVGPPSFAANGQRLTRGYGSCSLLPESTTIPTLCSNRDREKEMAASASMCTLLPTRLSGRPTRQSFFHSTTHQRPHKPNYRLRVEAAKLPAGVELPKEKPKLTSPVFGFTRTAEIWNSRACMIGLIGTFIVELILNKGILEVIGVDVGKGLDLPL
ncbi:light-harvesting complex-like protein OHP1, chloroplastic [Nymphaea colorata]|uniref:light-harvesting complex-like protein OHP1, chloroplastic n=1 Tax=Nymphaea colorata TaxID=210225 RepID=UPI00214EC694|nr:light-harvesting complex-like protein OHP1, chloroplastic [Nymphaea colorata]